MPVLHCREGSKLAIGLIVSQAEKWEFVCPCQVLVKVVVSHSHVIQLPPSSSGTHISSPGCTGVSGTLRFEGLPFCYNSTYQLLGGSYQIGVSTHLAFTASVSVLPNPILTLKRVFVDAWMAEKALWTTALPAAHDQSFQGATSLER